MKRYPSAEKPRTIKMTEKSKHAHMKRKPIRVFKGEYEPFPEAKVRKLPK